MGRIRRSRENSVAQHAVAGWSIVSTYATLHTNRGDIRIELLPNHAPKTVNNFVGLAKGTAKYTTKNAAGETTGRSMTVRSSTG